MATRERFPAADELVVGIPSEVAQRTPLSGSSAVVLVAHDYKYDLPVLRHVLASPAGYVGLLGSRRRGEAIRRLLAEEGVDKAALARIRVPIGLDLGARSAPEIALAILAEAVALRHGGSGRPLAVVKGSPSP
jgi:xanthine dehydrogenase accessory factor